MAQGESTAGLYLLISLLILLVVGALLYFGGVFGGKKGEANVDAGKPGVVLPLAR